MEQKMILSRLLDKYENSVHLNDPGRSHRRVMLRIDHNELPEYHTEMTIVRNRFNRAAVTLEYHKIISLEWEPDRPVLYRVILNLSKVQEAYDILGRDHPKHEARYVSEMIREETKAIETPWILNLRDTICDNIDSTSKLPASCRTEHGKLKELLHIFSAYDAQKGVPVTVRDFSICCFGNTQKFSEYQDQFLKICTRWNPLMASVCSRRELNAKEKLALLGIYERPELYPVAGRIAITTAEGVVDLSALFPVGLALPSFAVETVKKISLDHIDTILFIEDKTVYEKYILSGLGKNELAVYHGAFTSPVRKIFYGKIAESLRPEIRVLFWGNLDLGGFEMFGRLKQQFPSLEPLHMDAQTLEKHSAQGTKQGKDYWKELEQAEQSGAFPEFRDTIRKMLEKKVTVSSVCSVEN